MIVNISYYTQSIAIIALLLVMSYFLNAKLYMKFLLKQSLTLIIQFDFKLAMLKNKQNHSESRLKYRKIKPDQLQIDNKTKRTVINSIQLTKNKTEGSSSQHSKPNRKNSIKIDKKHSKSSGNKDSKDAGSHSINAERRKSFTKKNKTQTIFENEEIQRFIFRAKMRLKKLNLPTNIDVVHLQEYYERLRNCFSRADNPLFIFCMQLHNFYMSPLQPLFQMLKANEELFQRRQEISLLIDKQVNENERLWEKMTPMDAQIFKLKEKIQENRQKIESYKKQKVSIGRERSKSGELMSYPNQLSIGQPLQKESKCSVQVEHMGMGLKLDLNNIDKDQMGFHEEFYTNLDNFSESWRNQAIRQKRF